MISLYYITKNIATELILGTSKHEAVATNTFLENVDLGRVILLPPTICLQYHFLCEKKLNPYLGLRGTYTIFYNQRTEKGKNTAVTGVCYDNTFGYRFQVGADYKISEKIY